MNSTCHAHRTMDAPAAPKSRLRMLGGSWFSSAGTEKPAEEKAAKRKTANPLRGMTDSETMARVARQVVASRARLAKRTGGEPPSMADLAAAMRVHMAAEDARRVREATGGDATDGGDAGNDNGDSEPSGGAGDADNNDKSGKAGSRGIDKAGKSGVPEVSGADDGKEDAIDERTLPSAFVLPTSPATSVSPAPDVDVRELRHYAHLSKAAYEKDSLKLKSILSLLEYRPLDARWTAESFRPAYFLAYSAARRTLVASFRGTHQTADVLTDISLVTCDLLGTTAHLGVARSAHNLLEELEEKLVAHCEGLRPKHVVLTGHSLGAAVAAALVMLLRSKARGVLGEATCVGFCPSAFIVDSRVAANAAGITMVVHSADVIPRLSVAALDRLVMKLVDIDVGEEKKNSAMERAMLHGVESAALLFTSTILGDEEGIEEEQVEEIKREISDAKEEDEEMAKKPNVTKVEEAVDFHLPGKIWHLEREWTKEGRGLRTSIEEKEAAAFLDIEASEHMVDDHYIEGVLECLDQFIEAQATHEACAE